MDPETELNLIRKSVDGDHQAFRLLVESHQGIAYTIAYRFTKDEGESEDIVQEAFVKLWRSLSKYNSEYRVKKRLGKIVNNLCLDFLKYGSQKKMISENNLQGRLVIGASHYDYEIVTAALDS